MSSLLKKDEGVYNPVRRFAVTNITDEDFTSYWNKQPIVIKAHQSVTLPHHLADKIVDEMVDKIMIAEMKANELKYYQLNPNTAPNFYRAPSSLGVPVARKVWEDKIVRELSVDEETPEVQVLRLQIKEELQADMAKEKSTAPPPVPSEVEFADINNTIKTKNEVTNAPAKKGR